jgi:hypothetical protein
MSKTKKPLNFMEITDDWKKLKADAMATFIMTGLAANPSFAYLKPNELAAKAIELANALETTLGLEVNPFDED